MQILNNESNMFIECIFENDKAVKIDLQRHGKGKVKVSTGNHKMPHWFTDVSCK